MTTLEAILLGIVEGITEFLPVSSTGHMILTSSMMGIADDQFTKIFEICIQLGAILSVVVLYWKKFVDFRSFAFYGKLLVAVFPALVLGYLFNDQIENLLESPITVAISLVLGGIFLLFVDRLFKNPQVEVEENLSFKQSFFIGVWQCISMIPGVSRSAATIIGGMQQKLSRNLAAEFSFFLAVPTMAAASGYSLFLKEWSAGPGQPALKGYELVAQEGNLSLLLIGTFVSFVVAMIAIKTFISYIQKHGFFVFGVYRILIGLAMLMYFGWQQL